MHDKRFNNINGLQFSETLTHLVEDWLWDDTKEEWQEPPGFSDGWQWNPEDLTYHPDSGFESNDG